jgi:hypothetical protein
VHLEEGVASVAAANAQRESLSSEAQRLVALAEEEQRVSAQIQAFGAARHTQRAKLADMVAVKGSSFLSTRVGGIRDLVKAFVTPSAPAAQPTGSEPVGSYERKTQVCGATVLSCVSCRRNVVFRRMLRCLMLWVTLKVVLCLCLQSQAPLVTISMHKSDISTPASWSKVAFTEDAAQKLGAR